MSGVSGASGSPEGRVLETGTDTVRIEVRDGVGIITLTRPERRNALHREMYEPIKAALGDFVVADDVGAIVITGQGAGFCSGGDVRDGRPRNPDGSKPTTEERIASLLSDSGVSRALYEHPKVTIAAVNGGAVGAGMSIALACDMRIASTTAKFIGGWVKLAFTGDFGGAWLLTCLVGPAKALEILVTNATIDAEAALALGIVNRVLPSEGFESGWFEFARSVANGPRGALAGMKANVRDATALPFDEALAAEARRMVESSTTADHKAAVRAWLAGTDPVFGSTPAPGALGESGGS